MHARPAPDRPPLPLGTFYRFVALRSPQAVIDALRARLAGLEGNVVAAEVFDPGRPDEAWRLGRALRLDFSAAPAPAAR